MVNEMQAFVSCTEEIKGTGKDDLAPHFDKPRALAMLLSALAGDGAEGEKD